MLPVLSSLSPNAAVLLLTLGIALIAVELNRPGWILAGALGVLTTLLAAAAILARHGSVPGLALLAAAAIILLLQLRLDVPLWIALLGGAAGVIALTILPGVQVAVALWCGLVLAAGTIVLTRIARRARQNKGLD